MQSHQIVVRDIKPEVFNLLKERAKQNGRSCEAEVRMILRDATLVDKTSSDRQAESRKIRALFKDQILSDSTDLIREDRDR